MFKLTSSIIYLVLFVIFQNNFYNVSSFPTGAGSCDNSGIIAGHGAQAKSGTGNYAIKAATGTGGSFDVSITGGNSPKGLLLYVVDPTTKTGTGDFTVTDTANFQIQTDCTGGASGVTHSNPSNKKTPVSFKWTPTNGAKTGSAIVKAVVVDAKASWYILQDLTINLATGNVTSPVGNGTDTTNSPSPPVDQGFGAWIKKYSLFVIMIGITTVLYVIGSVVELMLKKQNSKARSFAKTVGGFGIAK